MDSTLKPKPADDPHDVVVVASDAVGVAPSDEELSNLLHQAAARHQSETQTRVAPNAPAGAAVPPVDTRFRPALVNDGLAPGKAWSIVKRALRAFTALLLALCIGLAAFVWRSYGDAFEKKIAKWTTQFVVTASLPPEKTGPAAAQPATPGVEATASGVAAAPPAPVAQRAAEAAAPAAAAPSAESGQLLQSMARDLASLGQEVDQLKSSIEQLKASQQQISREVAKPEQNPRPRISWLPPRPAIARARKPIPPYPPAQAAGAPATQQVPAPYYAPRQPDYAPPRAMAEPQADPESSIPRPPMPVR